MKKILLSAAIASLFAGAAFAQAVGDERAPASKPQTAAEKSAGKATRKAEGTKAAKEAQAGDDKPATAGTKGASKEEKKAAKAHRKATGSETAKAKKDQTTGAGGSN